MEEIRNKLENLNLQKKKPPILPKKKSLPKLMQNPITLDSKGIKYMQNPIMTNMIKNYTLDTKRKNKKFITWEPIVAKIEKVLYPIKSQKEKRKNCFDLILYDQENPKDKDKFRVYLSNQCSWLVQKKVLKKEDLVYIKRYSVTNQNDRTIIIITDCYKIQSNIR